MYAVERSGILRSMGVDTTDVHVAIAEFSRGTVATFENTWILPTSEPTVFDFKIDLQEQVGHRRQRRRPVAKGHAGMHVKDIASDIANGKLHGAAYGEMKKAGCQRSARRGR